MKRFRTTLTAALLAGAMAVTGILPAETLLAAAIRHGTDRSKLVTAEEVNNKPDPDYVVDMSMQRDAKDGAYNRFFLKDDLQTVRVTVEENNLNYMLQNATEKTQVMTQSVTIGGETIGYAGIKTKGNYTLTATAETTSDRFSFSLNFGKYIKKKDYGVKQNFYGLAKVSFNNFFFDKSMMKEYSVLRLMTEMGVPTPQYGLAKLYINNQYYGVYFMVENMDSTIMEQYLNEKKVSKYLTKPEYVLNHSSELDAYKDSSTHKYTAESIAPLLETNAEGKYTSSIRQLWEGEADTLEDVKDMLPTVLTMEEKLTLLSKGKKPDGSGVSVDVQSEEYIRLLDEVFVDTDEVIRYFAVHSFVCQLDDLFQQNTYDKDGKKTSSPRNYGLYVDADGRMVILPWDYDLAWGCFVGPNTPESTANWDIDKMYTADSRFENGGAAPADFYKNFPIFNVIYQNDALREKYHDYMADCSVIAALGGTTSDGRVFEPCRFARTMDTLYPKVVEAADTGLLAKNVRYCGQGANQPNGAFRGIPVLKRVIAMRALGVWAQVHGKDYRVSGEGVEFGCLGNDAYGMNAQAGKLLSIDADTGIIKAGNYAASGYGAPLQVYEEDITDPDTKKIADLVTTDGGKKLYYITQRKTIKGNDEIYIPSDLVKGYKDLKIFTCSEDEQKPTPVSYTKVDHYLKAGTGTRFDYLILTDGGYPNIGAAEVTLSANSYTYDGAQKRPSVVKVMCGEEVVSPSMYDVSYSNNVNAGTAKVILTGKGSYRGTAVKTFAITKAANGISVKKDTIGCSMSAKQQSVKLDAKATAGTLCFRSDNSKVKVSDKGVVTLPKKFSGTVKITVSAKGGQNYKDASANVTILVPKGTKASAKNTASKKMTVTCGKVSGIDGYEISYALNKKFTKAKTVKSSSPKKVISGLKKGKTYYVRVRACKKISGKNCVSVWSDTVKVKIKK